MSLVVSFYLAIKRTMSGIFIESKFSASSSRFGEAKTDVKPTQREQGKPMNTQEPKTSSSFVFEKEITIGKKPSPYTPSSFPQRFVDYYTATLKLEGDVAVHPYDPSDPGGATSWGISAKAHPDLIDKIRVGLSREEAFAIAYERYYTIIPLIGQVDPRIGFVIFDARFHGMKENVYAIQTGLTNMGYSLKIDSIAGSETMGILSRITKEQSTVLLNGVAEATQALAIAAANRTMNVQKRQGLPVKNYKNGFVARQEGRLSYAKRMYA